MSACAGPGCTHPDCRHGGQAIIKYDGNGRPVYANDPRLGNRAERRALARAARSRAASR